MFEVAILIFLRLFFGPFFEENWVSLKANLLEWFFDWSFEFLFVFETEASDKNRNFITHWEIFFQQFFKDINNLNFISCQNLLDKLLRASLNFCLFYENTVILKLILQKLLQLIGRWGIVLEVDMVLRLNPSVVETVHIILQNFRVVEFLSREEMVTHRLSNSHPDIFQKDQSCFILFSVTELSWLHLGGFDSR